MANNKTLFSIITISFNSAKTIEKTILSVLNQTYKNIEYIIIDGGSTDETIEIIKKYQDKISYWISEKDNGISDAFNKGILASHGDIIGIINSDDWYENNAIETISKLNYDNNSDIYIGALKYWNIQGQNFIIYPDKNYKKKIKFCMPHLNHPSSFFKRTTYNEIGLFDLNLKIAMDYDLFLRAYLQKKNIYMTDIVLANMLMGGNSNINIKKAYKEVFKISKNKILSSMWYILMNIKLKIKHNIYE